MGFEKRIYSDGDIEFNIPEWRKNIEEINKLAEPIDFLEENKKLKKIKQREVALKHLSNNSFIRIQDDGTIELFSEFNSGIRLDSNSNVQIFGDKIQVIAKEFDIRTTANGTTINDNIIGKNVVDKFPRKKGKEITFLEMAKEYGLNTNLLEEERKK